MTATSAPFGLRPVKHASGQIRIETAEIASGFATAIFKHSPVKMASDGTIQSVSAGEPFVGVMLGVDYIDATGRPCTGHWPAGQTLQSGTKAVARITRDPAIIYEIQASATLAQTAVGNNVDFLVAADDTGNAITGLSTAAADAATLATTAAQLQILGFRPAPDNEPGDAFPVLQVRIYEHQLAAAPTAGV